MVKGILFALLACFVWGLVFVIPGFMNGFSPFEIALGRFSFFGLISGMIFLKLRAQGTCSYAPKIWLQALLFSFASTFFCYTCIVLGLRHSTPTVSALILGISPITIAFYGNVRSRELRFKSLLLPSLFIAVGLVILNAPHIENTERPEKYIIGLFFCFLALSAWSWFVVANSEFFKKNPEVLPSEWSTMIGVSTVFWGLFFTAIIVLFFTTEFVIEKYSFSNPHFSHYLIGSAVLGLVCSWIGDYLWNRASGCLPVSLAGQLTIFETIFGVMFVYLLEWTIPVLSECVGIAFLLGAVAYGIHISQRLRAKD